MLLIDVFLVGGINDRGANAAAASEFQIVLLAATATFAAMALRRMMIDSLELDCELTLCFGDTTVAQGALIHLVSNWGY